MAKRDRKKDKESKVSSSKDKPSALHKQIQEQKISLQESISKLETELLKDDVKENERAKFSINRLIKSLQERLKNS